MGPAEIYRTSRTRLLDLARGLTTEQQAAALPPTPPWTVLDGNRHLTGVCCDVLDGNMPKGGPAGGDAWTAAQLAARAGSGDGAPAARAAITLFPAQPHDHID